MYHLFQIIYKAYTIEFGLYWGVMFGFRTFEADEYYNQKELQVYVPFMYIAMVKKLQDD